MGTSCLLLRSFYDCVRKREREQESVELCVRRLIAAGWRKGRRDEVMVREVWVVAREEGISVREVGRVVRLMEQACELMERDSVLHNLARRQQRVTLTDVAFRR